MINLLTSLYHDTFTVFIPNSFNSVCTISFRIVLRQGCIKTKHILSFYYLQFLRQILVEKMVCIMTISLSICNNFVINCKFKKELVEFARNSLTLDDQPFLSFRKNVYILRLFLKYPSGKISTNLQIRKREKHFNLDS